MEYLDNPIIIGILAFVSIVVISRQILALFLDRRSAEKKKWHLNDDTPLSHFISRQDLRMMQYSVCIFILLGGVFAVTLAGAFGNLPVVVILDAPLCATC